MFKKNLHLCFPRIHCLPSSHTFTLEQEDETTKCCNSEATDGGDTFSSSSSSSTTTTTEPNFSTVFAARRFFFSSPGTSNSILEDRHSSDTAVPVGGIPVRKYSPNPYVDFRKSMEEMVRARREMLDPTAENESSEEYEYLQELLLCYLSLNPKSTHKFIIGAFTDLLLSLMLSELPVIDGGVSDTTLGEGFWCS